MAIGNTISSDFDPRSSIVKSVFDCRLSGLKTDTTTHIVLVRLRLLGKQTRKKVIEARVGNVNK